MKLLIKSLSIPAIGGIFAGTAFAGPGDAYLGFPAASVAKAGAEKNRIRHDRSISTRSHTGWSESQIQVSHVRAGSSVDNVWARMIKSATSRHRVGAADLCRQSISKRIVK